VLDKYERGRKAYLASAEFNADRPEWLTNLGGFYTSANATAQAESYYRQAIALAEYFTPAYVNLADLYRRLGDESQVQQILLAGLSAVREPAIIQHALGLSYVRTQDMQQALDYLQQAADDPSAPPRYHYVYAIALHSAGQSQQAVIELEQALAQFSYDVDILTALVSINHELGDEEKANYFRNQL